MLRDAGRLRQNQFTASSAHQRLPVMVLRTTQL